MELHTGAATHTVAKRLWGILRVTLFMIRKGLISKRKLIVDMNVMMKRGKLWRKTLSNLVFHHHHHHHVAARGGYGVQEYEFSCSNSPNPVFFRALKRKHAHNYFPCVNPPRVVEEEQGGGGGGGWPGESGLLVPKTPDRYVFDYFRNAGQADVAVQERPSPLAFSPFSIRVSNYSEEEDESDGGDERNRHVDDEAEEFIRRFYEQLRTQSRTQLLQYQEESA